MWTRVATIATCLCFVIGALDYFEIKPSRHKPVRDVSMTRKPRAYSLWVGSLFTFGLVMTAFMVYAQFSSRHPAATWCVVLLAGALVVANWVAVFRSPRIDDSAPKIADALAAGKIDGGEAALFWHYSARSKNLARWLETIWHHWHNAGDVLEHPLGTR
jgi:hypothetical protein